jgi:hypothetical protein
MSVTFIAISPRTRPKRPRVVGSGIRNWDSSVPYCRVSSGIVLRSSLPTAEHILEKWSASHTCRKAMAFFISGRRPSPTPRSVGGLSPARLSSAAGVHDKH